MATRVFTDAELERLRSFPEINPDGLIRFFTLAKPHVEFVDPGRGRGPADRLRGIRPESAANQSRSCGR